MVKQIYKIPMPLSMEEYDLAQHYVTMVEKIAPSDPGKPLGLNFWEKFLT